jgi:hypothetical protein
MKVKGFISLLACLLLISCTSRPPRDVNNICHIFHQYPKWYRYALDVERRWKVPVAVQMAIIHQESKFDGRAQPPRKKLLWIIPWKRPSTAYGYTQALRTTWAVYKRDAHGGKFWASRGVFSDAVDFVGWYANQANRRAGILRTDAYRLYLAYHEGIGGYQQHTYIKKPWLIRVAHKVKARSQLYQAQLNQCHNGLPRGPLFNF